MTVVARVLVVTVLVLVGTVAAGVAGAAAAAAPVRLSPEPLPVSVTLDRSTATAGPGEKLVFVSTVTNSGDQEITDLTAHLNILTTDPDVYVDPEDWSPRRTQYVEALAAGESTRLTWTVQAVTSGPLVLFVSASAGASDQVESSGPFRVTVEGQRVVDATRVLPMVLWVPGGLLAALGATLVRRRRHR